MSRSLWLGKMFEGIGLGVGGDVRGGVGEMWGCVCLCVCVGGGGISDLCHGVDGQGR